MKQMYKVFLNDRVIKIGLEKNITKNQIVVSFNENCTEKEILTWFETFETSTLNEVVLLHPDPDRFFRLFKSTFLIVKAAGGVVVSDNKLLLIYRNGRWDLPKGKLEGDESIEAGALREVEEETGIHPDGIDHMLRLTYHMYKSPYSDSRGQWIFKETYWFQMNCHRSLNGIPQHEEGITRVEWIPIHNLEQVYTNTYPNLMQVLNLYLG